MLGSTALSVAGNIAGGLFSNHQSAKQAQKQMDFQERMYKNRYTYQMEDFKKAGLNPALAYSQGAGGSPSGSMGTTADFSDLGTKSVQTGLQAQLNKATVDNLEEQNKNINAQTSKTIAETKAIDEQFQHITPKMEAEIKKIIAEIEWGSNLKVGGDIINKVTDYVKNQYDSNDSAFNSIVSSAKKGAKKFDEINTEFWNNRKQDVKNFINSIKQDLSNKGKKMSKHKKGIK